LITGVHNETWYYRFTITPLIPQTTSSKDLLNHLLDYEYSNSIEHLVKSGFRWMELSGDLALFLPHTFGDDAISHLLDQKNLYILTYTIHLLLRSV